MMKKNINIKNILKIVIPSAIALTAVTVLCGAYYSGEYFLQPGDPGYYWPPGDWSGVIGQSCYCTHPIDQEYIEPTITPGKYYLNGDTDSAYLDVTESTWQLMPGENCDFQILYSLERSAFINESLPAIKTAPDEIIDIEPNCDEDVIAFYSMPHEYTVVTWHTFDIVWLSPGPSEEETVPQEYRRNSEDINSVPQKYWQNGGWITQGPQLIAENTLQSFGGDYILVE
ncbi:MAG: hypothetical protein K2J73_04475 [Oscillospiraceae bacterium]|nr:hypothetical protein [Oscillospiraceae bacterium]